MSKKPVIKPRRFMELAIEEMKKSIAEGRVDGKRSPLVGAVLVRPDGSVDTAFRGELREGDHAEFTLLERKNRANNLGGSILFATLEPCAPGARNHPKLGCAERIVNARIAEVWVGIEDPDPTVDRKGIKFLQERGIKVHMFDRELQDVIKEANKDFIEQAMERKAASESVSEPIKLSELEVAPANIEFQDLSPDALNEYRSMRGLSSATSADDFNRRLMQQGLLLEKQGKYLPSGFGLLLFGSSPRDVMPQAGLLGTIHFSNGTEEVRDFDGPMVTIPELALSWLREKLPNPVDRTEAKRKQSMDSFFELVREGIVNALVHRNYDIAGAKCQLIVTDDSITIKSPGEPVEPITLQQLQSFEAPMLSRNPILHYVFAKMELAEERGLGLKSLKTRSLEIGIPAPQYSWKDPYLTLTLYRSKEAAMQLTTSVLLASLSFDEIASWGWIIDQEFVTTAELMTAMNYDERKAQRVLKKLQDVGLLQRVGAGKATRFKVIR